MSSSPARRELVTRLLSGSAGLVALSALAVSAYQAYLSREQQRMSAWPYVTQGNTGDDSSYARLVQNAGLGPALVRDMGVAVDGRETRTWFEVAERALRIDSAAVAAGLGGTSVTNSSVRRGMVLLPGSSTELLRFTGPAANAWRRLLNGPAVHIRVCYCSLYGECWLSDSKDREPAPVRECPSRARDEEFES